MALVSAVVLLAIGTVLAARRRDPGRRHRLHLGSRHRLHGWVLLGTGAAYFAVYFASTDWAGPGPSIQLGTSLSWPLLALAVGGIGVLLAGRTPGWRAGLLPVFAAVVCLHYLHDPHVSDDGRRVGDEPTWLAIRDPRPAATGPVELTLRAGTFNPGERGLSDDGRDLGIVVYAVELSDPVASRGLRRP